MFCHSDTPQYIVTVDYIRSVMRSWQVAHDGVTLSAAGSLQWFVNQICVELNAKRGADPYQTINTEAAAVPAGSEGLFFLPYLAGERTPHADPHARGCFVD